MEDYRLTREIRDIAIFLERHSLPGGISLAIVEKKYAGLFRQGKKMRKDEDLFLFF